MIYRKYIALFSILGLTQVWAVDRFSNTHSLFNFYSPEELGFSGYAEFLSNQVVDDVGEVPGNRYHGDFKLKYENRDEVNKWVGDVRARFNSANSLMYAAPELYYERKFSDQFQLSFGKKILSWSQADKIWSFGVVDNRIYFDGFDPGQDGLAGFDFTFRIHSLIKFNTFLSYLYVPELNPSLELDEENGKVNCYNPWCNAPAATAKVPNEVPIFYNVNMPEISDVVFKPSAGFNLTIGNERINGNAFFMRKPENTISVSAEAQYQNETRRVFADITPEVYYHDVSGMDLKLGITEKFALKLNSLVIRPDQNPDTKGKVREYLDIRPKKIAEEYAGFGLEYLGQRFSGSANYIARLSNFRKEVDDPLIQYPRWNQAMHLNIGADLSYSLKMGLDIKYDTLTEDRLVVYKASYLVSPSFVTSLGVNMIGTDENEESYWSKFENNDSFYGSLKYIF